LAIVRPLVELHGGEVTAESAGPGLGSTFQLRLPLKTEPRADEPALTEPAQAPAQYDAFASESLAGTRVLLVEDEEDARSMLKALLESAGAGVRAVGSAAEAWAALEGGAWDVLVSDIGMPQEDGYSLVGRVRARDARRGERTPALALTAYARDDDRARALAAGFDAHMAKPVEPAELVSAVARLAGRAD
jgi:CheY-like chemotaxis protein